MNDQGGFEGKIFVGGITAQTTREDLLMFFSQVAILIATPIHRSLRWYEWRLLCP
jgi:hypothetical protein